MKMLLSLILTMLLASPVLAGDGKVQKSRRPIPNRYLVQFEDFVEAPEKEAKEITKQYDVKLGHVYKHGVTGFAMKASPEQAAAISEDSRIEHVEEEGQVDLMQVAPVSPPGWALDRINQTTLPLDHSAATGCNSGIGVIAYVLDTGVNPNATEFGTRLTNGYTVDGTNFSDDYGTQGHGTAVASIIGGATYGVARGVSLVNVKVIRPADPRNLADKIAGIDWVVGQHATSPSVPKVMNLSWLSDPSSLLDSKVIDAIRKGILVVVSAGNEQRELCGWASPGQLGRPNNPPYNSSSVSTITAGGTRLLSPYSTDTLYSFSNFGPCVDLFAPGNGVDALSTTGQRRLFTGTSAAAPFVTGAVARHLRNYIGSPLLGTEGLSATIESSLKSLATRDFISGYPENYPQYSTYPTSISSSSPSTRSAGRRPEGAFTEKETWCLEGWPYVATLCASTFPPTSVQPLGRPRRNLSPKKSPGFQLGALSLCATR